MPLRVEESFCKAFLRLQREIKRYLDLVMPSEVGDITGNNMWIIVYLADHEGEDIVQRDIEEFFGITASTVSRVLALMEKKRLIKRILLYSDMRVKKIVLTDTARASAAVLVEKQHEIEETIFHGMSPIEREFSLLFVTKMLANIYQARQKLGDDDPRDSPVDERSDEFLHASDDTPDEGISHEMHELVRDLSCELLDSMPAQSESGA